MDEIVKPIEEAIVILLLLRYLPLLLLEGVGLIVAECEAERVDPKVHLN